VLRGVDGLVFVADSQRSKKDENIESLNNLKENLIEYGYDIYTLPIVLQYNKRDLPDVMPIEEMQQDLNWNNLPHFEASAVKGVGVFDTLKMITKVVLNRATKKTEAPDTAVVPATFAGVAKPVVQEQVGTVIEHQASAQVASRSSASTAGTTVAPPPVSTDRPHRVEVREVTDEAGWGAQSNVPQGQAKEPRTDKVLIPKHPTLAEIESKLHQVDNTELDSLTRPAVKPKAENDEAARSQFADAFEVPHVVGMQKSLKLRKKKKRFFLFRWFGGDND